jgi:hypothetical protein
LPAATRAVASAEAGLGHAERQGGLFNVAVTRCEQKLPQPSVYRLLHAERDRLFPDELFADLYIQHGRRSVPPSILAVVMVLQRWRLLGPRGPRPVRLRPALAVRRQRRRRDARVCAHGAGRAARPAAPLG